MPINPTPIRQAIRTFLTPRIEDFIVAESVDTSRDLIPEIGTPHPDTAKYPHHKLCQAQVADDQGLLYTFLYLAEREHQDDYNWEFTEADIGGTKFKVVTRTYVTLREKFDEVNPAQGTPMALIPDDRFEDGYVLAERKQARSNDKELDSLFVIDQHTYIHRVPLGEVRLDTPTGRSKRGTTTLYFKGELIGGVPVETLAASPGDPYWGLQANGVFRELQQLSENWFAITESTQVPANSENSASNPAKSRVVNRVTPLGTDLMFYEVGSMPSPAPAYGSAHYDTSNWPDHELVYIEPADETGLLYKFYYAAERDSQDSYNFEDNNGQSLTRTYLIKRADYLDRTTYEASVPEVGTPDSVFDKYVFAQESVQRVGQPFDSLFITVARDYLPPVRTDIEYNDALERNVVVTRRVIPHGTGSGASEVGRIVEVQDVNTWYDIEITREVEGLDELEFPIQLVSVPADVPYRFPPLLQSANVVSAWAYAASEGHAASYSEDYYFDWKLLDPSTGPYEAEILRFITDDPDTIKAAYPIVKIATKRESVAIVGSWFRASSTNGNSTFAIAKEFDVPSSIHGSITVGLTYAGGTAPSDGKRARIATLSATPDFDEIVSAETMVVGYETRKIALNLFEVSITRLNTSGLYPI